MKSAKKAYLVPAGKPIKSEDFTEFHECRLLLLLRHAGQKRRTDGTYRLKGMTKLAKIDFFIRYPQFFGEFALAEGIDCGDELEPTVAEPKMIRYRYGPWDKRYNHVLPRLEAKGLIQVMPSGNSYEIILTPTGVGVVDELEEIPELGDLTQRVQFVGSKLKPYTGSKLKDRIYSIFAEEVGGKSLGEGIG